jgi:hypothetical protein
MTTATYDDAAFDPVWLRGLCDRAQTWVAETGGTEWVDNQHNSYSGSLTPGYVDLMFSFGLASIGAGSASRELVQRADSFLKGSPEPHPWNLRAFRERIDQALASKPLHGTLSPDLLAGLEQLDRMPRYAADRMRELSRILEPDRRVEPYRHWATRISAVQGELAAISDLLDPHEIAERIERLLCALPAEGASKAQESSAAKDRVEILTTGLNLSPLVGSEFARTLLAQVPATYDAVIARPARKNEEDGWLLAGPLLERALHAALVFSHEETTLFAANRLRKELHEAPLTPREVWHVSRLAAPCVLLLRKHERRAELEHLCSLLTQSVPADCFGVLLPVAMGWAHLGQRERAEEIVEAARAQILSRPTKRDRRWKDRFAAARAYPPVVVILPHARQRFEELVTQLPNIPCCFTTGRYYSRTHLEVVEAVVLAVVEGNTPAPLRVNG